MGKDWEPGDPPEEDDGGPSADPPGLIIALAKRAAAKLPDIAKIPPEQRGAFCEHAATIIADTQRNIITRGAFKEDGKGGAAIFEEIERAAVDLSHAVVKLTGAQFKFLQAAIDSVGNDHRGLLRGVPPPRLAAVPILALASSKFVGKNPRRSGQEGNVTDWEFQCLVYGLWMCARKYGGDLNASKRDGEFFGAMFKAIDAVRQYIIHVRVPSIFKRSQGATVVKIVTNAKKGIPPGREPTAVPKHLKK
jgi:hypothetical protein